MPTNLYAPRTFLRQVPKPMLDDYFHGRGLLTNLDIAAMPDPEVDAIFQAWEQLPPETRVSVDADFQAIDRIANEHGIRLSHEEAAFQKKDLRSILGLQSYHEKAFWVFLNEHRVFEIALRFLDADRLRDNYWLRRKGVPSVKPRDDKAACRELAGLVGSYFHQTQGRGKACTVEVYKRGESFYYYAYPEDYGIKEMVYEGEDQLTLKALRPAFEVVFAYNPAKGTLDVYHQQGKAVARVLQELFARTILLTPLGDPEEEERVYKLDLFKDRRLQYVFPLESGIRQIQPVEIHLVQLVGLPIGDALKVMGTRGNIRTLHDALEERYDYNQDTGKPLIAAHRVTKVVLRVRFAEAGKYPTRFRSIILTGPNGCNLKDEDERDAVLRQMLIDSGIEIPGQKAARLL